jgi:DNA-binding ferritin-like protein
MSKTAQQLKKDMDNIGEKVSVLSKEFSGLRKTMAQLLKTASVSKGDNEISNIRNKLSKI